MLTTTITNFLRHVQREYDMCMEYLGSTEVILDILTAYEARMIAIKKKLEYFSIDVTSHSRQRLNSPEYSQMLLLASEKLKRISSSIAGIIIKIKNAVEEFDNPLPYEANLLYTQQLGRPRFVIERDQLIFLREYGFSWTNISNILGVSVSSVYRRRHELGLDQGLHSISDTELDQKVSSIKERNPSWGSIMIEGYLMSRGCAVPRSRITSSMARVDPIYTSGRWATPIERRRYRVPGPGSLWHIDGNHKLIRFGIYVHGAIDGFSRVITFLKASTNNRSQTVLDGFLCAVAQHHLPSRIRTDLGTENVLIGEYMVEHRPVGHNAWLKGPSVHNQRIERLWRDVRYAVLNYWRAYFQSMEENNILNVNSEIDVISLHFVYMNEINAHLSQFTEAWNNHKIRTENQATPWQLYIHGMLQRFGTNYTSVREVLDTNVEADENFGNEINFVTSNLYQEDALQSPSHRAVPLRLRQILQNRVPAGRYDLLTSFKRAKRACRRFFR